MKHVGRGKELRTKQHWPVCCVLHAAVRVIVIIIVGWYVLYVATLNYRSFSFLLSLTKCVFVDEKHMFLVLVLPLDGCAGEYW